MSTATPVSKFTRLNPDPVSAPYVRGTEIGNFYLIVHQTEKGSIVGFRPLDVKFAPIGSTPQTGVSTRVRVIPISNDEKVARGMKFVGLEQRLHTNETETHYSNVTSEAESMIEDVVEMLYLLGL